MAKPIVRLRAVQLAFGVGILAVLARAGQVQLVQGARYRALAEAQRTEPVVLPAPRGALYDRNGIPLALSRDIYHVGIAPRELRDRRHDVRTIAGALGLSVRALDRRLRKPYAYLGGPFTATQVAPLRAVRGVHLSHELHRFYPSADFARTVIGRPGGDGRPASGLERMLDTLLAGTPGSAVVLRDGRGRQYESPARLGAFPIPGSDAYLTLDAELQDIVERALAEAVERYDASGGDVVVLDPGTGEVLAVASRRADGSTPPTVFTSVFEPGSTAKIFAAAALLTHGLVDQTDSVYGEQGVYRQTSGKYVRAIRDDHPEGWLTLRQAIQVSSNIGMAKFASRLTPEQQFVTLRAFGLGSPTGIEFPAESRGLLPRPSEWSQATATSLAIGYELAVTPLQLAAAYAAIANDGVLMQPTLVREVRSPSGAVTYRSMPQPVRRVASPDVAQELRSMLRGVVYEGGTGSTAALTSYDLAGKTGTARRATQGGYVPGEYTATFASLFPAEHPQLVSVVKLDDPRGAYARVTAAPVTRSVIEQALASRSTSLNAAALESQPVPAAAPVVGGGSVPYVLSWPPESVPPAPKAQVVPPILGLSLRAAARALHRAGLEARVDGWGRVTAVTPAPGTRVPTGSLVMVTAGQRRE